MGKRKRIRSTNSGKRGRKKGLSQVVQIVLLILISISMIATFFIVSRNLISKTGQEALEQKACLEMKFAAADFCYSTGTAYNIETGVAEQGTFMKFSAMNSGDRRIEGFLMSLVDSSGNSKLISTLPYQEIAPQEMKQVFTDFIFDTSVINRVKIVPELNFDGKILLCSSQEREIGSGEIGEC